jgi:pimeloyl-ACP methyl ester carboxylesterase
MDFRDDDLRHFDSEGALPLPAAAEESFVDNDGARIWYATCGAGPSVILLHGGLGNSGNWGYQVPALVEAGFRAIVIDSRGHGRSTRDEKPYSYQLLASDVLAVMNRLEVEKAACVGWSDGACTSLVLAHHHPQRVSQVFYFACNMDPSGTLPFEFTEIIGHCFERHKKDYAALSATPDRFQDFVDAVSLMQRTEPNYSRRDLGEISVPVTVALGEYDEFIKREHVEYLASSIPDAELLILPGVSHFAPLQRPALFNRALVEFLGKRAR